MHQHIEVSEIETNAPINNTPYSTPGNWSVIDRSPPPPYVGEIDMGY